MLTVNAPAVSFTLPTSWVEVTLGQFLDYNTRGTTTRAMLECFASDTAMLHALDAGAESTLLKRMAFLSTPPDMDTLPVPVMLGGIAPPMLISECSLGLMWQFEAWLAQHVAEGQGADLMGVAMGLLGVYLYTPKTGKGLSNLGQLDEIDTWLRGLPVTEALPLAAFFLSSYNNLPTSGRVSLLISLPSRPPSRWRMMMSRTGRCLARWRRWCSWRRFTASPPPRPKG